MSELKNCPFCGKSDKVKIYTESMVHHGELLWIRYGVKCKRCSFGIPTYSKKETAIRKWNTRPAEDAKDSEIERLKNDLEIQKNLTRMACFESNRAYDEVEKWKKMFYDLIDKQSNVATDPKVIIVGTDTNVPANAPDTGKMEEK